jgi:hypothetical protein
MNSTSGANVDYIARQSKLQIIANAIFGFVFSLLGIAGILAAIIVPPPPATSNLYGVMWIAIFSFVILALIRNKFLRVVFAKMSHPSLLELLRFGRATNYFMIIVGVPSFIIGLAIQYAGHNLPRHFVVSYIL